MKKLDYLKTILILFMITHKGLMTDHHNKNIIKKTFIPYQAVITQPVIDLTCNKPIKQSLAASPSSDQTNNRSHQGLYNEIVTCIKEHNEFVQVIFQSVTYNTNKKVSSFWTKKQNITPLKKIKNKKIVSLIPHATYAQEPTITLIHPWKKFSVGTRFKYSVNSNLLNSYKIMYVNYLTNQIIEDTIPQIHVIKETKLNSQASRTLFIKVLNNLINCTKKDHIIPYVWGGSSFVHSYKDNSFYQDHNDAWQRHGNKHPYTGYDCSELVMRMAQIAGIDFPWKTSTTIKDSQQKITKNDILQNGDLIWTQGHIVIISDIQRNEIIEARGYPSGYGRIHKLKLNELFEGVTTFNDLLERYHTQKQIQFKNKDGSLHKKTNSFLLLKLIN